jgi:hypothetical protein
MTMTCVRSLVMPVPHTARHMRCAGLYSTIRGTYGKLQQCVTLARPLPVRLADMGLSVLAVALGERREGAGHREKL